MSERDWNGGESRDWNNKDSGAGWNTAADEKAIGTIDHYELLHELGTGGFGSVYLARDTVSRTFVAVKGLPQQVNDSAGELERIRANYALVSKLKHPNVAAVLALHRVGAVACGDSEVLRKLNVKSGDTLLVMDYAPGVTLDAWCRQFPDRKVPVDQAIEVTRQIAAALDVAHKMKIVHRDIKPQNVMVETLSDGTFTVRVLDFGLAAEVRSSMRRASKVDAKDEKDKGDSSGTIQYMAPEQLEGHRPSAAMDQYALAALFYELVTGDVPFSSVFECGDKMVIINVVTTKSPEIPKELPQYVRKALARALAKKTEKRFVSCGDFVAALQGKRIIEQIRWWLVGGMLMAVALVGFCVWWLQTGKKAEYNLPDIKQSVASNVIDQVVVKVDSLTNSGQQLTFDAIDHPVEQSKINRELGLEFSELRSRRSHDEREAMTRSIQDDMNKNRWWNIPIGNLLHADLDDARVLYGIGRWYADCGTNEQQRARFFLEKAASRGCTNAVVKLQEVQNTIKVKPYFDLVRKNNLNLIRKYITRESPRLDLRENGGDSLVHAAARCCGVEVLKYLQTVGFSLNQENDKTGETPLYRACRNTNAVDSVACITMLVENGADPSVVNLRGDKYALKYPIFHVRTCEAFDLLLQKGADPKVKSGADQSTILHEFVRWGDVATPLIERAIRAIGTVDALNGNGETPLHVCVVHASREGLRAAECLLKMGADPNAKVLRGYYKGLSPLHMIAKSVYSGKYAECIEPMIDLLVNRGADKDAWSENSVYEGNAAFIVCDHQASLRLVRAFCEYGVDLKARLDDGSTLLHVIADGSESKINQVMDCIAFLVEKGIDKDGRMKDGRTPLHIAAASYSSSGVKALIHAGADVNAVDERQNTPLAVACSGISDYNREARIVNVRLLLQAGANPSIKDKHGKLPIDKVGDENVKKLLLELMAKDEPRQGRAEFPIGPSARVVATIGGKEVTGAKIHIGKFTSPLPGMWNAETVRGGHFLPDDCDYLVDYENDGSRYQGFIHGGIKVDWEGQKTFTVELKDVSVCEPKPGELKSVILPGGAAMTFCWCPATTGEAWKKISGGKDYFMMGGFDTQKYSDVLDKPHPVRLTKGFWIGKYEVTQKQWISVMGVNKSRFKDDDRPADGVVWQDCERYIAAINNVSRYKVALPSEAQWEYACKAGSSTTLPNGLRLEYHSKLNNAPILDEISWYSGNSSVNFELDNGIDISAFKDKQYDGNRSGTHPVGMKKPNAWGIHDMIGNVNEWCQDWFVKGYYSSGAELQDPKGPELGTQHVNKGGSFLSVPLFCCSSYRHTSSNRNWGDGFRLVLVEIGD